MSEIILRAGPIGWFVPVSHASTVYPIKAVLPNEKVYYNFNNKYEGDQL